jgi:SAM-dependent methyltransferase
MEGNAARAIGQSYEPGFYPLLVALEDRHFWFRARNKAILALVSPLARRLPPRSRILEVGCGTGNVIRFLEQECGAGLVVGMDLFAEGLHYARQRTSCLLVQGDVLAPPLRPQFDIIGLFDVLEHLPDDGRVLQTLRNMLVPGGCLLLSVPAHPSLWGPFDEASCHLRRYGLAELESELVHTGFRVEYLTHYMALSFPLLWLRRRLSSWPTRRRGEGALRKSSAAETELRIIPVVNELLACLLSQEARLIGQRRVIPFGASLLAVARKPLPRGG